MSEKQNHSAQFATDVVHATKTAILLKHSWDSSIHFFTLFMRGASQTGCMLGLTSSKGYCVCMIKIQIRTLSMVRRHC